VVRLPIQKGDIVSSFLPPTPGDNQGPDDIVFIQGNRWVGIDGMAPAARLTLQRRTTYRHCTCVDPLTGGQLDLKACVGRGTVCDWTTPDASAPWRRITLVDAFDAPFLGASGWSAPQTFTTNASLQANVQWNWRQDVLANRVTGLGTCPGTFATDCKTHGAIFSRVDRGAIPFSGRDLVFNLRDSFAMYDTPNYQQVPPVVRVRFLARRRGIEATPS
jgi:hypothetical protein